MPSKALLVGGLASLLTVPVFVGVIAALAPDFSFTNVSATAWTLIAVGSVATLVAFFGMYYLFTGSTTLRASMLVLAVVGIGLTFIPSDSGWTYNSGSILWGGALLAAGYLLRTGSYSVWLSWLGFITGALFVLIGAAGLAGQKALAEAGNGVSTIFVLAWSVWIGWVMVRKSRETVSAAMG